ncbi:unnamed protein product [Nippostrongylus brasiliensis]|uniref:Probable muscarinic acetylcholine receptor gar-1 (inferred by orthology to a C. elegans protein) n=1 Tax=Nippostrongylus brasiliensis TaxID=27835 RepID=A0A158R1L3_NIPBR|nr:unnamed protein product [Nippostrongylus brasiliensis]
MAESSMDNITIEDTSWNPPHGIVVQITVWLLVIVVSLVTVIGNAMVVIAYKIERSIGKKISNRYIASLAISDLIIGIEGFPLFTVYVMNGERWPLGTVLCRTWLFLDYTLCLVSILTVLLITMDRYLSVCHTAKYMKWQNPTKTQFLIIFSWLIPAIIFGAMMYGWDAITGEESMTTTECSAPFLSNPYVNMGMYVAYYWTTLVAMLILYKVRMFVKFQCIKQKSTSAYPTTILGIHQAAKSLEKKAKAKEQRNVALILSQRLGTQVGVTLMLHTQGAENPHTTSPQRSNSERRSQNPSLESNASTTDAKMRKRESWAVSMKRRIRSVRYIPPIERKRSSSDSSCSSVEGNLVDPADPEHRSRKRVQFNGSEASPADNPENHKLLSAEGVTRKISSLSMGITRERIISSIFAPITVFHRKQRRTTAEKRAHKAFRTITFIVGCFAILWSPYYIMATIYGFCKGKCIPALVYTLSYYMCYLNSTCNPFAYAMANRQFRMVFLRMLRGNFNKNM